MEILIIVGAVIVGFIMLAVRNANENALVTANQRAAHVASEDAYRASREALAATMEPEWALPTYIRVGDQPGFIAIRPDSSAVRIVACERVVDDIRVVNDEELPAAKIVNVSIHQPVKSRVVTHKDSTPVAVGSGRSPVGRAVVGGVVAGPVGALVGASSGLGGKSKIEHVESTRHETVYSKAHPTLIVEIDDLVAPRRRLRFDTVAETNDWSSRIWNAMNKARR